MKNETKFFSLLNKPEVKPTPSSSKIITEHRLEVGLDGKEKLIKDRKIDIYSKIQASREQTEIEYIVRRAAEGDTAILNAMQANYIDVTDAPKTLAEAQQFVIRAKEEFKQLPKEIRNAFNNDAQQYVAEYGTDHWRDVTGLTAKLEKDKAAEEAAAKFKANQEKAFENLANGTGANVNE